MELETFGSTEGGEKEWTRRKRALDENWTGMREKLHAWSLMKEIMPLDGSKCAFCDNDVERSYVHHVMAKYMKSSYFVNVRFGKMVSLR